MPTPGTYLCPVAADVFIGLHEYQYQKVMRITQACISEAPPGNF